MNIRTLNTMLEGKEPEYIIDWDFKRYHGRQVMTTSFGIESALLLHIATRVNKNIPVIFIDTGYLFDKTYQFGLELTSLLGLNLKMYRPLVSPACMEEQYGELWKTNPVAYGEMRKKEPLRRALKELGAKSVLHGIRAYQNHDRAQKQILEQGPGDTSRIHPILHWTEEMVLEYFKKHQLPYHPMLEAGYGSVGDTHSTEPGPGRNGRWPGLATTECGMHENSVEGGEGI